MASLPQPILYTDIVVSIKFIFDGFLNNHAYNLPVRKDHENSECSGLKNNPSEALRMAHDDLILVMNRNEPDALMIGTQIVQNYRHAVCVKPWQPHYSKMTIYH